MGLGGNTGGVGSSPNASGNAQAVANMTQSNRGPLAIPLNPDWSVVTSYAVDLSVQQGFGTIDMVQTLFIDNSLSASPFYAIDQVSQQTIVCPPYSQGYFPFLVPSPPKFIITSAGGVRAPIEVLNFPVQPGVWSVKGSPPFLFDGGGNLKTTDATLSQVSVDVVGAKNALAVDVVQTVGGGGSSLQYSGATASRVSTASGGNFNLVSATAAKSCLLHSARIDVSPLAYAKSGVAQLVRISLGIASGAEICGFDVWLPAAAPAGAAIALPINCVWDGLDVLFPAPNVALQGRIFGVNSGAGVDIGDTGVGGATFSASYSLI